MSESEAGAISQNTTVRLGLVILVLGTVGGIGWNLMSTLKDLQHSVERNSEVLEDLAGSLRTMDARVWTYAEMSAWVQLLGARNKSLDIPAPSKM